MTTDLLTTHEVAALTGVGPTYVHRWAAHRNITRIKRPGDRRPLYPADAVHAAHHHDTTIPPELRLRRFVARALIA